MIKKLLFTLLIWLPIFGISQSNEVVYIDINKSFKNIGELIDTISNQSNKNFSYLPSTLSKGKMKVKEGRYLLEDLLDKVCTSYNAYYQVLNNVIIIKPQPLSENKQKHITGRVIAEASGEAISYAILYVQGLSKEVKANRFGYFSFKPPPRKNLFIWCKAVDKKSTFLTLDILSDSFIIIALPEIDEIKKVTLKGKIEQQDSTFKNDGNSSTVVLTGQQIKQIPPFLGEYDALNSLIYTPGVTKGTEGNNGLFIRGGSPDQNLITLDGAILYNPNHFFGLFSPFSADAIQNISLQKGGFEADIGGRLSSHLAIDLKEGNTQKHQAHFSLSPLAISASANGPLKSPKTTYLLSFRRSYFDLVVTPLLPENNSVGFFFYDINAKVTHKINDKKTISFSYFNFKDKAFNKTVFNSPEINNISRREESEQAIEWGNNVAQIKYQAQVTDRKFLESNIFFTQFGYSNLVSYQSREDSINTPIKENSSRYNFNSDISTLSTNHKITYWINNRAKLKFGLGYLYHSFKPSSSDIVITNNNITNPRPNSFNNDPIFANEIYAFAGLIYNVSSKITIKPGFRMSSYHTTRVNYFNPQPRVSFNHELPRNWSWNIAATSTAQYLHFATNNTIGIPLDLWLPATDDLAPSESNQISLGLNKNTKKWSFTTDLFYKTFENLLDYIEGEEYLGLSNSWEEKFVQGNGLSYGIDALYKKKRGLVTGWIGYTWSINSRQFDSINNGEVYPFKYDRRHNLSAVFSFDINDKWSTFGSFVYGSGSAITLPIGRLPSAGIIGSSDVLIYGERNAHRLKDYHRLDIGFKHLKKKKHFNRIWNISIYNIYNRQNPFYITPGLDDAGNRNFVQVSLLPLIPSLTYRIEFN